MWFPSEKTLRAWVPVVLLPRGRSRYFIGVGVVVILVLVGLTWQQLYEDPSAQTATGTDKAGDPSGRRVAGPEDVASASVPQAAQTDELPRTLMKDRAKQDWLTFAKHYRCVANDSHYVQIQRDLHQFGVPADHPAYWMSKPRMQHGITQRMVDRAFKHLSDTVRYRIINGVPHDEVKQRDSKWGGRTGNYDFLLRDLVHRAEQAGVGFPDVDFVVNMLDEPRVLYDTVNTRNRNFKYEDEPDEDDVIDPKDAGDVVKLRQAPKDPRKYFSAPVTSTPFEGFGTLLEMMCGDKEFVATARKHSSVFSPSSSTLIHRVVPVFSRTKLVACMGDILWPDYMLASWQPEENFARNKEPEHQWEQKKEVLYWRGSATGGNLKPHTWRYHHRVQLYMWTLNDSRYDTGIVAVGNCAGYACQEMRRIIPKNTARSFSDVWKYKYVLDMDGHSYSQRLKSLFISNSLTFKMNTLFPEFWSFWFEPWKHYIPVDLLNYKTHDSFLDDLNEKLAWAKAHDWQARQMAEESTKRMATHMRVADVYCYMYRLFLEYAARMDYTPAL